MEINYTAVPTFAQVHRDPNRYLFIRGPVGSGKSSGCIMHLFMNGMQQEPNSMGVRTTRYAVVRATYPALRSTVIKSWKDWFKDQITIVYSSPISGKIAMDLPDGTKLDIEIFFLALDKEDDINKLQSLELTGCHINEAAEVTKSILDMVRTRINRYPAKKDGGPTRPFVLLDYNSVSIDHWLYVIAEEAQPPRHSFYSQPPAMIFNGKDYTVNPYADNLVNLPDGYYDDMVLGSEEDFINVFILNNYGNLRQGKPVYGAYDDKIHASNSSIQPLQGVPLIIGVDVGLTPAAAFTQLDSTGRMIVLQEIVTDDKSVQEFADSFLWPTIHNKYGKHKFELVVDPAARNRSQNDKRSAMDILVKAGLPVRLARTNEPLARREAVSYFLLRRGGFLLDGQQCPTLRKGFISEYKFEKIRGNAFTPRYKEKPEKNIFSHVADALQYAAMELSEGRTLRMRSSKFKSKFTSPADSSTGY